MDLWSTFFYNMDMYNKEFMEKYGRVFQLMCSSFLLYEDITTNKTYKLPSNLTTDKINELMDKSLSDNFNYLYELCKDDIYEDEEDALI